VLKLLEVPQSGTMQWEHTGDIALLASDAPAHSSMVALQGAPKVERQYMAAPGKTPRSVNPK
jgi:hypothetical protein